MAKARQSPQVCLCVHRASAVCYVGMQVTRLVWKASLSTGGEAGSFSFPKIKVVQSKTALSPSLSLSLQYSASMQARGPLAILTQLLKMSLVPPTPWRTLLPNLDPQLGC